jgi:hypothetical protein
MTGRIITGLNMLTVLAPRNENMSAVVVAGSVAFQLISTCIAYWREAMHVPAIEESLFVPRRSATGRLGRTIKRAGSWIRPPPPATESINPARNEKPQITDILTPTRHN